MSIEVRLDAIGQIPNYSIMMPLQPPVVPQPKQLQRKGVVGVCGPQLRYADAFRARAQGLGGVVEGLGEGNFSLDLE